MDALAALEALEAQEQPKGKAKKKNPPGFKPTNTKFRNPLTNQNNKNPCVSSIGKWQASTLANRNIQILSTSRSHPNPSSDISSDFPQVH